MPKSTKKKKEKSADFAKAKLKLGKGKQQPTNATDTSFKARSIVVPTQNVGGGNQEGDTRTRSNHSLSHLLGRLRHYSPSVRRDALVSLRDVLAQATELRSDALLAEILEGCARLISDEDASVRKVLVGFFGWLLDSVPPTSIEPHAYLLILHTMSSLSHIFPDVRVDAVRLLDLLLNSCPTAIASACSADDTSRRIVDSFCSLLGVRRRASHGEAESSLSFRLSAKSRNDVLKCLYSLLVALSASKAPLFFPTWYLRNMFDSKASFDAFNQLLSDLPTDVQPWHANADEGSAVSFRTVEFAWDEWSGLQWKSPPALGSEARFQGSPELMPGQAGDLRPAISSICSEAVSAVISRDFADSVLDDLETLRLSLKLMNTLFAYDLHSPHRSSSRNGAEHELRLFFSGVRERLPLRSHYISANIATSDVLRDINQAYCSLVALFVMANYSSSVPYTDDLPLAPVFDYVTDWYQKPVSSASEYYAFLPVTWCLLVHLSQPNNSTHGLQQLSISKLVDLILHHATIAPIVSSVKSAAFEHVAGLVLLQTSQHYVGPFHIHQTSELEQWMLMIPQILWEAGGRVPVLTKTILHFLLRSLQQQNPLVATVADTIGYRLIPFFYVHHPVRGPSIGPIGSLTDILQKLAYDVASALPSNTKLDEAIELTLFCWSDIELRDRDIIL